MLLEIAIIVVKILAVIGLVLPMAGMLGWIERKGSALIQDRIGASCTRWRPASICSPCSSPSR